MNGRPERGLLDTSVLIARESGRQLHRERLPQEVAISIVTKAELRLGVLVAADVETRDRRLATLDSIAEIHVVPIWGAVERVWAGMRAYLAASGRSVKVNDLWIAATATAYEMPVITQDRDFYALSGVNGLTVIEV
ncbi:MAG TPA: type II toxin-antitoxin system VapC family toxin [Solirubrobacterales bacterium]|nr:type II toxin-antitoxin system VapC family toxin [Solirubrobacterales bacterium]